MKKIGFIFLISALLAQGQPVRLPLGHRAYDFLDRMQTRGLLDPMFGTRPYMRPGIADALYEIQLHKHSGLLTGAELDLLEQLLGEFAEDGTKPCAVQDRYRERHFLTWSEDNANAFVDLLLKEKLIRTTGDKDRGISQTTGGGWLRGSLGDRFGFSLFTYSMLRKGEDIEKEEFNPSLSDPVILTGSNAFSDNASASFFYHLPHLVIELGRNEAQWGPGRHGSLMLSSRDAFFDMLRLQFQYKRFQLTSIHGKLNYKGSPKYLAAHRLELRLFPWLNIAGNESVVYGDRDIEPMYLNPLMPYHVAEHHLGDLDNNTMSMDLTLFPAAGHKGYLEIFLDDFTSSENPFTYYGSKWALLTGWRWAGLPGLRNCDFEVEYARIEPFVYTHKYPINIYQEYGRPIGHAAGPNSDDLFTGLHWLASANLNGSFFFTQTRHGEGGLFIPDNASISKKKKFLSGTVETRQRYGFQAEYQLLKDCFIRTGYAVVTWQNYLRETGDHRKGHQLFIDFELNY